MNWTEFNNWRRIDRLLRLAAQYIDIKRVYLDAGREFYNADTISTVNDSGCELVIQGVKHGSDTKWFRHEMAHLGMETDQIPYGVSGLNEDKYTALGQKSEAENQWDDYACFYTNADREEYSVGELTAGYRNRWGIETAY